jgi:hypothetical protein
MVAKYLLISFKTKNMDRIEIEWIDSKAAANEWEYLEDLQTLEPITCTSIGFLIEETPAYKTIAHSVSATQVCGRITIPVVCIKKCKKLK